MINIAISLASALVVALGLFFIKVYLVLSVPLGLIVGLAVFIFLGKKIQDQLQSIMLLSQKEIQAGKLERAIEVLKSAYALKNKHIFVESQLNSQIGMLYYILKDNDTALSYLEKGFPKHFVGQGMLAAIYYRRKNYDEMHKVMQATIQANKKESIVYALYAYLQFQLKDKEKAVETLQQGLKRIPDDERLTNNLILLQNNKKMKMRSYGDLWTQFMLERAPRMMQQQGPPHMRMSKKALFR